MNSKHFVASIVAIVLILIGNNRADAELFIMNTMVCNRLGTSENSCSHCCANEGYTAELTQYRENLSKPCVCYAFIPAKIRKSDALWVTDAPGHEEIISGPEIDYVQINSWVCRNQESADVCHSCCGYHGYVEHDSKYDTDSHSCLCYAYELEKLRYSDAFYWLRDDAEPTLELISGPNLFFEDS